MGAHSCPKYWLKNANANDIFVNYEPIHKDSWRKINQDYIKLLRRQCVFDYCEINLPYLEEAYSFKTPPLFSELKPKKAKEYDVIFIGSINKSRINILKQINKNNINLKAKFNIFGTELYNAIDRARIYLNLDLDRNSTFNEYRFMSCAQTNTLFAGHSGNIKYHPEAKNLLELNIFRNDSEMIEGIKNLISDNAYMLKAFTAQYEYAKGSRKKFDLFIKNHFLEAS